MPPPRPRDPFRSTHLIYRAVRTPGDNALFTALNEDRIGYQNGNASNAKLPGQKDAENYQKYVAEETLIGAVICLPKAMGAGEEEDRESKEGKREVSEDDEAGIAIGCVHLKACPPHFAHHRNTEIGIDILPDYQGRGYGGEAIVWVLHYAFRRVGLHKVRIRALGWNEGAIKLYERLGFKHEGREREALWHEGRFWDGIEMGMIDREWWEMQQSAHAALRGM
ncbi:acetyltransferase [Trematosphaeria pertusa]|uniref:Acetyltransferase n=1 Tax=Trematosphaeria pertusa TaxID=390896 RepID=A0A6A6II59_9PLEO|nr:acetyltransferase [Trematosphaeria pertusa]KAF2250046.1 acetyltransferase [Trematosphaeria pertusa]